MLPHLTLTALPALEAAGLGTLPQLLHAFYTQRQRAVAALETALGQVGFWSPCVMSLIVRVVNVHGMA